MSYSAGGTPLPAQAAQWRTPQAGDAIRGPKSKRGKSSKYKDPAGRHSLVTEVSSWPTPAARDHKGANSAEHVTTNGTGRKHMDQLPNFVEHCFSPPAPATPDGAKSSTERRVLNPRFVEWLMGWPIGWTNLDCAETESSAWLQRARGWLLTLSTPQAEAQGQLL